MNHIRTRSIQQFINAVIQWKEKTNHHRLTRKAESKYIFANVVI